MLRQLSPPRNFSQITLSTSAGISKPVTGISRPKATKVTAPTTGSTLLRVNASLSVSPRPTTSRITDRAAITTLTMNGHRPGPGLLKMSEPVAVGQHRAADADRDTDQRAHRLIDRTARRRALLLQFVGDLGLDLGEDVAGVLVCSGHVVHGLSPRRAG